MTGFAAGLWSRIRDRRGIVGFLFFVLLAPLSVFYRIGLAVSRARRRAMPRWDRAVPVLTVGNLSTGGTGKTPLVILLAEKMANAGRRPAVLSRGYRGKRDKDPRLVKDFEGGAPADSVESGDEARLIAEKVGVKAAVVVANDRVKGCALAVEKLGADLLILDDGFQNRMRFPRAFHMVAVNAARPLNDGFLLPAGELREPVKVLAEANAIVLTHVEELEPKVLAEFVAQVKAATHDSLIVTASHQLESLAEYKSGESFDFARAEGRRILAFSALGYPESFERLLAKAAGVGVTGFRAPDHHRWNDRDFAAIRRKMKSGNCELLVTTEKDAARVARFPDFGAPLLIAKLRFSFIEGEPQLESALKEYLESF